jgi:sialidase-1
MLRDSFLDLLGIDSYRLHLLLKFHPGFWSEDGGLTWSAVKVADDLIDPTCQASIIRMDSADPAKRLLLFLNPASAKRENISIRFSKDNAKSWSEPRVICDGPGAYSDLVVLPDLTIGALYENRKTWPYSKISFARLNLEWITNHKTDKVNINR